MLTRKRVLAAKIEATPGTAEDLSASEAAFNVFDATIQPNIDFTERLGQSAFSPLPGALGARGGTCTFAIELHGSGTPNDTEGDEACPAWAETFLPACGFTRVDGAAVYKPDSTGPSGGADSSAVRTLTIGLYEDGVKKALKGCMGNAVFTFASGQIVRIEFTFQGLWTDPADVALLAPDYPAVTPLRFADANLTIGSWAPKLAELTIDLGNDVQLREDANTTEGYSTAIITGRRITGSLNPEASLVAEEDVYGDWLSYAEQALAFTLGAGNDGNTVAFAAPKLQFTNVQEGDRNGIQIDEISFQLNRSADAGDDELTITFS